MGASGLLEGGGAAQGWRVATKIAPSRIAGAGNGRFVTEDVIAGSVVAIKPIQAISRVEALHTVAMDTALSFLLRSPKLASPLSKSSATKETISGPRVLP